MIQKVIALGQILCDDSQIEMALSSSQQPPFQTCHASSVPWTCSVQKDTTSASKVVLLSLLVLRALYD
jgi:hypothetical protein